jgi:hypothetical protein
VQLAEEAIGQFQDSSHPDEQRLRAVDKAQAVCWAVDSHHLVHNVGLIGNTRHVDPPSRGSQRAQQPAMLAGPEPVRLYDNPMCTIRQLRERYTALTDGHGIPDITEGSQEPYDGIIQMIRIALADTADMDLAMSLLVRSGIKLTHPEAYSRGLDLEEFKGFVANILRWLMMNYLLEPTSMDLQVRYMGACLMGETQEWFHRNGECFDCHICDWTLETVVQGLQKRFPYTLTYYHGSSNSMRCFRAQRLYRSS